MLLCWGVPGPWDNNSISSLAGSSQLPALQVDVHRDEGHRGLLGQAVAAVPHGRWHCQLGGFGFQLPPHSHAPGKGKRGISTWGGISSPRVSFGEIPTQPMQTKPGFHPKDTKSPPRVCELWIKLSLWQSWCTIRPSLHHQESLKRPLTMQPPSRSSLCFLCSNQSTDTESQYTAISTSVLRLSWKFSAANPEMLC